MITLGLNAAFHDSAAVLVIDGVPVAAAEEERFTRIKHAKRPLPFSAWELPFNAIAWCLQQAGATLADVAHVAYGFDPALFRHGRPELAENSAGGIVLPVSAASRRSASASRDMEADAAADSCDSPWDPLFCAYMLNAPRQLADGAPHHLRGVLRAAPPGEAPRWRWHAVAHHLAHQASAFLAAPFEHCAVMTLDGRGERATTCYGHWRDGAYQPLGEVSVPHSLGLLYEQLTRHLGFLQSSDEYKVMALAALGEPRFAGEIAAHLRLLGNGGFAMRPIDWHALAEGRGAPGLPLRQAHLDLAASLQQVLEDTVLELADWLQRNTGERQLALAGGVALNCVMNARLRDEGAFEEIWVQPAAGDAGTALGAALWVDARERLAASAAGSAPPPDESDGAVPLAPRRWRMEHAYLGPGWDDAAIEQVLLLAGLEFDRAEDDAALAERGAELLAGGAIVGWFQGRMEWGPRALGARSILASPTDPAMQQRLNELKDREDFRPVAPVLPAEDFADWFGGRRPNAVRRGGEPDAGASPFMLFTWPLLPQQRERVPSACHTDGSARAQTIERRHHPRLHALLRAFERQSGVPMLVNTSFNVRSQPIVCTPKDALEAFFTTPLDALLIGRCVLLKPAARRLVSGGAGAGATDTASAAQPAAGSSAVRRPARPLRVLTWHVHGNYLYQLTQVPHGFWLATDAARSPHHGGRCGTLPWGDNVHEVALEQIASTPFDVVLYQHRNAWDGDRLRWLSDAQRALPRIVLEHDPPQQHPTDTLHWCQDRGALLVHVTPFNALMWDSGITPACVVEHGVKPLVELPWHGDVARGLVVVNHLATRGRRLGLDLWRSAAERVPLALLGMGSDVLGGHGEVAHLELPRWLATHRFFFHPARYTSLGLAVIEAMLAGMPVVGLATTELSTLIDSGRNGFIDTRPERLHEAMHALLRDPGLARAWGEAGQADARRRFGIERFVDDWLGVLARVTE